MQLLWNQHPRLILHQNWLTVLCIFLIWYLFIFCCRKWRMFWILPVFDLVDTSIFPQCWNAIAVPASRAFAHKRSICAGRSEFKPQWDPTARRLSPLLPVSHMVTLFRPLYCLLTQLNGFENMKWSTSFAVAKKIGENGIGARSLPPEHFASTLDFSFPTIAGGYTYRQDLILAPSNCQCLVTLGQVT